MSGVERELNLIKETRDRNGNSIGLGDNVRFDDKKVAAGIGKVSFIFDNGNVSVAGYGPLKPDQIEKIKE